jgi:hypothetical protein
MRPAGPGRAGPRPARERAGTATFSRAVADLEAAVAERQAARAELEFHPEPAPRKLAPFATALAAAVRGGDADAGWGRLVVLYDPAGQRGWGGHWRVIAYVRAELEPELAGDPLLGPVGWSWLTEALDASADGHQQLSGTVTRVVTEGFGAKEAEPVAIGFELRASWSPAGPHGALPALGGHLTAWAECLCTAAGLPPVPAGVAVLRPTRRKHGR